MEPLARCPMHGVERGTGHTSTTRMLHQRPSDERLRLLQRSGCRACQLRNAPSVKTFAPWPLARGVPPCFSEPSPTGEREPAALGVAQVEKSRRAPMELSQRIRNICEDEE